MTSTHTHLGPHSHPASSLPACVLTYDEKRPPFSLLCLCQLLLDANAPTPTNTALTLRATAPTGSLPLPPTLTFTDTGEVLAGLQAVLKYLGRFLSTHPELTTQPSIAAHLYGDDDLTAVQIDELLQLSSQLQDKATLVVNADKLTQALDTHTYLLPGDHVTVADLACYDTVQLNVRWPSFYKQLQSTHPALHRWYTHISSSPLLSTAVNLQSSLQKQKQEAKLAQSSTGSFEIDLGDTSHVITRFPPEPSGFLHIGHAKAALLNDTIAKKFNGKTIVRFDDTNPSKEKQEYVDSILQDLQTLGIDCKEVTYTSDWFPDILRYAEVMLRKGLAYIDDTPVEKMRQERMDGIESKCRSHSIEQNLKLFEEMKVGSETGVKCCMRAKIDMSLGNKAMRDPTLFRCNVTLAHHRTGDQYKAYPTYDFACPIVDSLEGVTHALRTNEYRDRNEQYYWVIDALELRKPLIRDYSRLNFVYTTLSKRKLTELVSWQLVHGWDDPRMPTIRGILRRGMTVQALREFMTLQGFSMNTNLMEWDKIWTINKRIIDPVAKRYTAITQQNRVRVHVEDVAGKLQSQMEVDAHPKNKDLGKKTLSVSPDVWIEGEDAATIALKEELTLMYLGNVIVQSINLQSNPPTIEAVYHPEGDVKTTDKKLTWINAHPDHQASLIPVGLVELDYLISVPKIEEGMDFRSVTRDPKDTWQETVCLGEASMSSIAKGEIIQLNRRGYFICDSLPDPQTGAPMVCFMIPDGRAKKGSSPGGNEDTTTPQTDNNKTSNNSNKANKGNKGNKDSSSKGNNSKQSSQAEQKKLA